MASAVSSAVDTSSRQASQLDRNAIHVDADAAEQVRLERGHGASSRRPGQRVIVLAA